MTPAWIESRPLRPAQDLVTRRIAGEHLLVPVRSGAAQMDFIYTSNEVGCFVFGLLDGRRAAPEIARAVSEAFDVDGERALADVLEFLGSLAEAGLVVVADPEGLR